MLVGIQRNWVTHTLLYIGNGNAKWYSQYGKFRLFLKKTNKTLKAPQNKT